MPDLDAAFSVALQMVHDESHAQEQDPETARAIRRAATGHAAALTGLAAEQGRGESRATIVDGAVVVVTLIWPRSS